MAQTHTVFVSHAHADNELCDQYVTALRKHGLDVWYDRTNMQDGHFLSTDIEHELRTRSALVVMLTSASVASYWVNLEVSAFRSLAAQDHARVMLPVRIGPCEVPLLMRGIKWVDALSLGFDPTIVAISTALGWLPTGSAYTPVYSMASSRPIVASQPQDSASGLVAQAKAFIAQGRTTEAISCLERATLLESSNAETWANLGRMYNGVGRFYDSLTACDRALALDPRSALAWYAKGIALAALGQYTDALVAYDRALTFDPTFAPPCWNNKGTALTALRQYEAALAAYDQALAHDPSYASAWHNRSVVLRELGLEGEAKQSERQAKALGWRAGAH